MDVAAGSPVGTSSDLKALFIFAPRRSVFIKGHEKSGTPIKLGEIEPNADIFARFTRFGCYLGATQIVCYFNRKPCHAMPNLVGSGPWYMLMDVAVGGLAGPPANPKDLPARMDIAGVTVVQYSWRWQH
jgi:hypothetical protein